MQYKMFVPILGGVICLAGAIIPTLAGISLWVTATVVGIVSIVSVLSVSSIVGIAGVFSHLRFAQRSQIAALCRLAVGVYALWVLLFVFRPSMWAIWVIALCSIVATTYGVCRMQDWRIARAKPEEVVYKPPIINPLDANPDVRRARRLLSKAGHPNVRVIAHEVVIDEYIGEHIANQFLVRTPSNGSGK